MIFQRYRPFFILINNVWKIRSFISFPEPLITKDFHLSHPNMYTAISQDGIISLLAKMVATFIRLLALWICFFDDGCVQKFCLACFLHCLLSCQVFKVLCVNQTQITFIYEIWKHFSPSLICLLFTYQFFSKLKFQNFMKFILSISLWSVFWYHI